MVKEVGGKDAASATEIASASTAAASAGVAGAGAAGDAPAASSSAGVAGARAGAVGAAPAASSSTGVAEAVGDAPAASSSTGVAEAVGDAPAASVALELKMPDPESLELALREIRKYVTPIDDDVAVDVNAFVTEHLEAGISKGIVVELGRLFLLNQDHTLPWAFFEPIEAMFGLKVTMPGFAIVVPKQLHVQTARMLLEVRRKIRRVYLYPFLVLPLIVTAIVALAFFASPLAVTVAAAIGAASFAATGVAAQLVNQHVKELEELTLTLKPALAAGAAS